MAPSSTPILHVDMDAFYASIEVRDDPSLAGRPVVVGGPAAGRGVVAAASYPARRFGVRSAMPTAEAQRLCPELVVIPPHFEKYTAESRRIMQIFRSYTPLVEPLSLDEAFLDVSGCERLCGAPRDIGLAIKKEILAETGLVASVGVAPSKFLAKLASDLDKPDGFRVILPHEVRAVLDPLPVAKIHGVGPRTAKRLAALGVATIGDLAARARDEVEREFGASGAWIHDLAHGLDDRRVTPRREEKSHGKEQTFERDVARSCGCACWTSRRRSPGTCATAACADARWASRRASGTSTRSRARRRCPRPRTWRRASTPRRANCSNACRRALCASWA
jgi:DNA polymerase-4